MYDKIIEYSANPGTVTESNSRSLNSMDLHVMLDLPSRYNVNRQNFAVKCLIGKKSMRFTMAISSYKTQNARKYLISFTDLSTNILDSREPRTQFEAVGQQILYTVWEFDKKENYVVTFYVLSHCSIPFPAYLMKLLYLDICGML